MKRIINLIVMLAICLTSFIFCRELEVEFISDSPWLYGNYWLGGTSFIQNSIAIGSGFSGLSTLDSTKSVNIDIRFSTHADSQSVAPVYGSSPYTADSPGITGEFLGWGTFPGTAWDISDPDSPRRLNLCFFEHNGGNLIWNPESVAHGNYEYLLVMFSNYDEGAMYENLEAYNMDVQYFCWLKKKAGQTWFDTEPAVLQFRNIWDIEFNAEPGDNQINLEWQHENQDVEILEIEYYEIYRGLSSDPDELIAEVDVGVNSYLDSDVINLTTYYYKIIGLNNAGEPIVVSDVIRLAPFIRAYNAELISNWDENTNPYMDWGLHSYNDIWGYTDENGIEYALLGTWNGTHIIDISSNPSHPQEVGFIPGSFATHRDIKTFGHYMYIGTEANAGYFSNEVPIDPEGIQVVDISDPTNANLINEWDGVVQSHNIMEAEGYLYVIGSVDENADSSDITYEAWGLNDLIILDLVTDPENPQMIGSWNGDYLHDVCIYEDILYGCGIMTNKMYAFDIADKTNPQMITEWGGIPSAHACWVSEDGATLFTGSETTNGHIISWDVTDVENGNVNLLDEWTPPGGENWSAHNLFVKGDYLYISYYVYGLQILNISDPANMENAAYYDTFGETPENGIFSGAWGTFPFFNSTKVIVSDMSTGLYVVNYGDCVLDECGVCGGNGYVDWACNDGADSCWDKADTECDCEGNFIGCSENCDSSILDCAGTCRGDAVLDCAGICGGDATTADCAACTSGVFDCAGTCDGDIVFDCAGTCDGDDISCLAINELIIPEEHSIHSIYPNPFNPIAIISFSIPESGFTTIVAYDITGKKLETLISRVLTVGFHTISWNASSYPTGVYFIRMDSGGVTQTQKVIFLK